MESTRAAIKVLATNWGYEGSFRSYLEKVKKDGYDGIEIWWPMEHRELENMAALLQEFQLEAGFLCGAQDTNYQEHLQFFRKTVEAAATNQLIRPLYINCHSGRDYFSFDQGKAFFDFTANIAGKTGVKILHETHRGRLLYSAPVSRQYLEQLKDLRLTLDISHWCNVSESMLANQPETVSLALERTDHIHARIGHPEGPQVNDPRAPEWKEVVDIHLQWWDKVITAKKDRGETMTVLAEFGPPDYMPTLPYTRKALSDQWAINLHMKNLVKEKWG